MEKKKVEPIISPMNKLEKKYRNNLIEAFSQIVKIGDFTLSSELKSDFYIDCKEILLNSDIMKWSSVCVMKEFINITSENKLISFYDGYYISLAGVTSGADPIVCGIVSNFNVNGLFIRKKEKGYGTKKLIEGKYEEGGNVIIVDDVLTTGESIQYAYDVLIDHKLIPIGVIVLVDRQENDAKEKLEQSLGIPVKSVTTRKEILNGYIKNG